MRHTHTTSTMMDASSTAQLFRNLKSELISLLINSLSKSSFPPPHASSFSSSFSMVGGGGGGPSPIQSDQQLSGRFTGRHNLTYDQFVSWHKNGYLIIRGAFESKEIDDVSKVLDEIKNWPDVPTSQGGKWKYFDKDKHNAEKRILNRIERLADHPGIWKLSHDERIFNVVSAMLGDEAVLFKDKSNYKLPGGGGFTPHQDIQPRWDSYAQQFISVLVSVDYSRKQNGCLEVSGGHYGRGLIGRYNEEMNETETAGMRWEYVETAPGDLVFFDGRTPHRSKDNKSDKQRRNIYFTYNRRSEGNYRDLYYADKHSSFPPDADQDKGKSYKYKI